ncbi:hypothetical protein LTR36_008542 [Oleoguttula mirabilis]|uniref:Uncharacterized protein n=1 Tax=Oleoguttula mirabilis TaxID=1507867 RepID=A0AAV9JTD1_9PEZI|nr:hypothetical protein LTR36_008542 [Oleoguttula mirabilis]
MTKASLATLPAELRVRCYEFALPVGRSIKHQASQPRLSHEDGDSSLHEQVSERVAPFLGASLLFVNRQTYQEALPIFYKTNTVSLGSSAFYSAVTSSHGSIPDVKHLVHVRLSDFAINPACTTALADCVSCQRSTADILRALLLVPHLRTVSVDYGETDASLAAFTHFKSAASAPGREYGNWSLTCTGIGRYNLRHNDHPNLDMTMTNAALVCVWTAATPDWVRRVNANFSHLPAKTSDQRAEKRTALIFFLMCCHDHSGPSPAAVIPRLIAAVWPRDVPVDFRRLGEADTLAYVGDVDDALAKWLVGGAHTLYLVTKW